MSALCHLDISQNPHRWKILWILKNFATSFTFENPDPQYENIIKTLLSIISKAI